MASILACALGVPDLRAELPLARLHSVFPPGGKAGTTFEVAVTGQDLDEATQIHFSSTAITATPKLSASKIPDPNKFIVTIAAEVPPGIYDARVLGRFGISNPRGFAVGTEAEVIEKGNNHSSQHAMAVPLGATVNGHSSANSADYFQFEARKNQRVLIKCDAGELDSKLDPVLVLSTPQGRELERSRRGDLLDFTAPADGQYILMLHDLLYRGGEDYFYRLAIGTGPHIDYVFPPLVIAGLKSEHAIYGRNLPGEKKVSTFKIGGKPLEQLTALIDPPRDAPASSLDTSAWISPSAAVLDGFDYRLTAGPMSNPILLTVAHAPAPVIIEREPNDKASQAQMIPVPCEFGGQFFPQDDIDWVTFKAMKGEVYWIELFSQRLGLPTDPFLLVQRIAKDKKGEEEAADLQELYDSDTNIGGVEFNTSSRDPSWRFEAKESGAYRIQVRDLFNRGEANPARVYRLSIRKASPDFCLVAIPAAPPSFDRDKREAHVWTALLRRGDFIPLKVLAFRRDNFDGEITLKARDLPPGVVALPARIPAGQNTTLLLLQATEKASDWFGSLKLMGEARVGTNTVTHLARGGGVVWNVPDYNNEPIRARMTRDLLIASAAEESPFGLEPAEAKTWETSLAAKLKVPLKLARRGEFKDKVKLRAMSAGSTEPLKEWEADAKATETTLDLDLAKTKLPVGAQQIFILAQTSGKYQPLRPEELKAAEAAAKTAGDHQSQAEKVASEAKEAEKAATALLATATKALVEAEKSVKSAETNQAIGTARLRTAQEAKLTAEKAAESAAAKSKQAEHEKEMAIKLAKEASARLQARDAIAVFHSPPINLQIASAPITLALQVPTNSFVPGSKVEIPVKVARHYGFTDSVDLTIKGGRGLKAQKVKIPNDQTEGKLTAETLPEAKPGEQKLTLRASVKFNGQDLILEQPLVVHVLTGAK